MTVATTASTTTVGGNGVTTTFSYNFIADSASAIQVIYTDVLGVATTLTAAQYTLVINAPAAGQIWGVGGTVLYPIAGPPIANGTSLTISRIVPLTQVITISNQGDFAPQVIEEALDTLCFEIQQIAARTGQFRGTWVTGASYTFGDIVIDGTNGNNTSNGYLCIIGNTSNVWATDLAAGDWTLAFSSNTGSAPLPLAVVSGGSGRATGSIAYGLIAAGTTALGIQQTLAIGATTDILVGGGAAALPIWTAATGSGSPVRANTPTLITPVLGVSTATSINFGGNALGTYTESASFTPTLAGGSVAGVTTYVTQSGKYSRIGNIVVFSLTLAWSNQTGSGQMVVGGLPFNIGQTCSLCAYYDGLTVASGKTLTLRVQSGGNGIGLYASDPAGGGVAFANVDTTCTELTISGSYLV